MTLQEVAEVSGGVTDHGALQIAAVTTDSRRVVPDSLFVALVGERFDGHDFLQQSAQAGAVAAMISAPVEAPLPVIRVDDTLAGLGALGAWNRQLSSARVIGITGSQGKTTVKEMCGRILKQKAGTMMTSGNLNNAIGVPLTLLDMSAEDEYAVIEMGANAPGEIAYTASLAAPDLVHITNVAGTHLEGFGSIEGVSKAKSELWTGLREGGTAVVNLDDRFASDWLACLDGKHHVGISASGDETADYSVTMLQAKSVNGSSMMMHTPHGDFRVDLPLPGKHNVANALAAAALSMEAGCNSAQVQAGLDSMQPVSGRLSLSRLTCGAILLDDSYNASPSSFRAAIDVLAEMKGRKILVAGDMGELGVEAVKFHREIGEYAASHNVDVLMTTGVLSEAMTTGFGSGARHFASRAALAEALRSLLDDGVSVLVKGSRSAGMDTLVKELKNLEA